MWMEHSVIYELSRIDSLYLNDDYMNYSGRTFAIDFRGTVSGRACCCVYIPICASSFIKIYTHSIFFMHKHVCYQSKFHENSGGESIIPSLNHHTSNDHEDSSEEAIGDRHTADFDSKGNLVKATVTWLDISAERPEGCVCRVRKDELAIADLYFSPPNTLYAARECSQMKKEVGDVKDGNANTILEGKAQKDGEGL